MGFFSRKSLKPLRTITRQTGFLWLDIVATSGPRFWQVAVLASVAALVQGGGLLLRDRARPAFQFWVRLGRRWGSAGRSRFTLR
jgi:hypothetical protein